LIVIRAHQLIDGNGGPVLGPAEVVVEGERIQRVGQQGERPTPPGALVVDLGSATLLPGLIDAHVHFFGQDPRVTTDPSILPLAFRAIRSATDAAALLDAGFTTVRCVGSPVSTDLARAVDLGLVAGPRIISAGEFICATGGPWDPSHLPHQWAESFDILADGAAACRAIVRRRVREGVGVIKIGVSAGRPDEPMHAWSQGPFEARVTYSQDEVEALVDEAHAWDLRVSAHAIGADAVRRAVLAGVDTVEHGHGIDDPTRELLVDRGVYVVPTLSLIHLQVARSAKLGLSASNVAAAQAHLDTQREDFGRALDAGVRIALGTDVVGPPWAEHGINALEFQLMAEYGASPMQAIVAGTRSAADAIGLLSDVGTLEAGKFADLVATHDDPLTDVAALQRLHFVMQGGRVVRHASHADTPQGVPQRDDRS
jgi:imidazolonepropionase-like amidohydrolase